MTRQRAADHHDVDIRTALALALAAGAVGDDEFRNAVGAIRVAAGAGQLHGGKVFLTGRRLFADLLDVGQPLGFLHRRALELPELVGQEATERPREAAVNGRTHLDGEVHDLAVEELALARHEVRNDELDQVAHALKRLAVLTHEHRRLLDLIEELLRVPSPQAEVLVEEFGAGLGPTLGGNALVCHGISPFCSR